MENSTEVRIRRAEQDIETLRTTQNRILDLIERFAETREETRDTRTRPNTSEARLDSIVEIARGNRDILRAIAKHYNVTYEWPLRDAQSD